MPGELPLRGAEELLAEHAGIKEKWQCPTCGSRRLRRLERMGFLQNKVYSMFGYYPWRCGTCKTSFYLRRRSFLKGTREKEYFK